MISRRKLVGSVASFLGFCGVAKATPEPQKQWFEMDYIDAIWYEKINERPDSIRTVVVHNSCGKPANDPRPYSYYYVISLTNDGNIKDKPYIYYYNRQSPFYFIGKLYDFDTASSIADEIARRHGLNVVKFKPV